MLCNSIYLWKVFSLSSVTPPPVVYEELLAALYEPFWPQTAGVAKARAGQEVERDVGVVELVVRLPVCVCALCVVWLSA